MRASLSRQAARLIAMAGQDRGRQRQWTANLHTAIRTPRGIAGLTLTGIVVVIAVAGPFVAPFSATAYTTGILSAPSAHHILGGDVLGRDVLSRLLDGGWVLLVMAVCATALGIVVGAAAGVTAAYVGGRADALIMRTADVALAFPQIVFALVLVSMLGPKLWLIVVAVGFTHVPAVARVLRAATLDVAERDFVKAVELHGVSRRKIMSSEIMPNLVTPLMVETGLRLTYSIVTIAGLAFLGFGQQPPAPNWGVMINENRIGITVNPWATIAPASLIALLTVGVNTFTDAVARAALGVDRRAAGSISTSDGASREPVGVRM